MPKQSALLTDTQIKALKPKAARYRVTDADGLLLEVMPSGSKIWRYRYRLNGERVAPLTIGDYPAVSLAAARKRRDDWAVLVARGESPKQAVKEAKAERCNTIAAFSVEWLREQIEGKSKSYSDNMHRIMEKDILPWLGAMPLGEVKPSDVLALCDNIKKRGSPKMALLARNTLKRLYDFAIARQLVEYNPAAALPARFIATQESRTRFLSGQEIGHMLRCVDDSDIRRAHKLTLHLLALCMTRKCELTEAKWVEFDLEAGTWDIPVERMQKGKQAQRVYLSSQALGLLHELKALSRGSAFMLPSSRSGVDQPIAKSTLNQAVKALGLDMEHFVLHDFRRTASTHLHEMGYLADAIEKALSHKIVGMRGVYNVAEYAEQRKVIMQAWGDFVQSQIQGAVVLPLFKTA